MATHRIQLKQSGAGSWVSDPIAVGAAGFRVASLTLSWGAVASTAGVLAAEGTDDPTFATWVPLTVSVTHGTWPNVAAVAANAMVVLSNCPGFVRLKYTRSAGGGADQFNVYATLTE